MGIDVEIRAEMRSKHTPQAFSKFLELGPQRVVLDDLMTRVFMARGTGKDGAFTGLEFYDEVMKPVRKALHTDEYYAFVLIADNKAGVPREKQEEQARRSQSRAVEPYATGSVFCEMGIRQSAIQDPEPFVAQRLFSTRELRSQLWQFVLKRMKHEIWPQHKLVVFDFESSGPHVIDSGAYSHRTDLTHRLGEADLAWPFYFWLFHEQCIVVDTIDTDIIPISIAYVHQADPVLHPKQLHWRCVSRKKSIMVVTGKDAEGKDVKKRKYTGGGGEVEYCDLLHVAQRLPEALGLTKLQTVLYCILSKSDFVQKKWLSHFANLSHIADGCRALTQLESVPDEDIDCENVGIWEKYTLAMLASRIRYSPGFIKTLEKRPVNSLTNFADRDWLEPRLEFARGAHFPTPETYKLANRLIRFNLCYWTTSWHEFTLLRRFKNIHVH